MRDGSATRKKLERCALNLFVNKGITETTIKDIATEAEIAEGTLYRHYKSKDALAKNLFLQSYEEVTQALKSIVQQEPSLRVQIYQMVQLFAQKFDEDPILFRYLLLAQHNQLRYLPKEKSNAHHFFSDLINKAMQKNQLPKGDPHTAAAILMGIVLQAAVCRVYKRISRKMSDDVELLTKAIIDALQIN